MQSLLTHSPIAEVVLDSGIDKPLDYAVDPSSPVTPGMRVEVPVRGSLRKGTVIQLKAASSFSSVRQISRVLSDKPLVTEELFLLAEWIASYYAAPFGKVIRWMLPPSVRSAMKEKRQLFVRPLLSKSEMVALIESDCASSKASVLGALLQSPQGMLLTELIQESKGTRAQIEALAKEKALELAAIEIDRSFALEHDYFKTKAKRLTDEQREALAKISATLTASRFETHLLYGVTGSGKTEVYLQAIELALSLGKGAILLVPEVALTSQTVERLRTRFEERVALLHHRLSAGEKRDVWHRIFEGKIRLVVGARSAIFSPVQNLGLIIVDEEHDSAYKQSDDTPCYHARDVAVMRGKFAAAAVVLGSATPSLESFYNAKVGKYQLSPLLKRAESANLPQVTIVDMKREFERSKGFTLFSERLLEGLDKRIKTGEQVILFLNRRGFHTSAVCSFCGEGISCPSCSTSLSFHKGENLLACHLCDFEVKPPPRVCPKCRKEGGLKFKGAGTERVERSLQAIFPGIRVLRIDADTTRHKGRSDQLLKEFRAGKADVLIGTQMIAKGLHFPSVTLVGILQADSALQIPDFRSAELVFQLLTQVAGRSGRSALKGEVIIQTHLPDHPVIVKASQQDYPAFFEEELATRELFDYPPFSHLVKCLFWGKEQGEVMKWANGVRERVLGRLPPSFMVLPVVACGHAKVKDHYRYQFLVKGKGVRSVLKALEGVSLGSRHVKGKVDVDPLSTYF